MIAIQIFHGLLTVGMSAPLIGICFRMATLQKWQSVSILISDCTDMVSREKKYYQDYYDSMSIRNELLSIYNTF